MTILFDNGIKNSFFAVQKIFHICQIIIIFHIEKIFSVHHFGDDPKNKTYLFESNSVNFYSMFT